MHFDTIIGNPPYQRMDNGFGASALPIYQDFIYLGRKLDPDRMAWLVPSRWFSGGKGLDTFRKDMIADRHWSLIHEYVDSTDIFGNVVDINGGVMYGLWERCHDGDATIVQHQDDKTYTMVRPLGYDGRNIVIRNSFIPYYERVKNEESLMHCVATRDFFGYGTDLFKNPDKYHCEVYDTPTEGCYRVLGLDEKGHRCYRWIRKYHAKSVYREHIEDCYKLFMPKVSSSGNIYSMGIPAIGYPNDLCTETYLMIGGRLDSELKAVNIAKYTRTRFFRVCLYIKKNTHHCTRQQYRFVPMQDFTISSDIDWSKSIGEIDEQLYRKYDFSDEEIAWCKDTFMELDFDLDFIRGGGIRCK